MRLPGHDAWSDRTKAIEKLTEIVRGGATEFDAFVPIFKKHLQVPMSAQVSWHRLAFCARAGQAINVSSPTQVNDLRSAVVKVACQALAAVSGALGDSFEPFASHGGDGDSVPSRLLSVSD